MTSIQRERSYLRFVPSCMKYDTIIIGANNSDTRKQVYCNRRRLVISVNVFLKYFYINLSVHKITLIFRFSVIWIYKKTLQLKK